MLEHLLQRRPLLPLPEDAGPWLPQRLPRASHADRRLVVVLDSAPPLVVVAVVLAFTMLPALVLLLLLLLALLVVRAVVRFPRDGEGIIGVGGKRNGGLVGPVDGVFRSVLATNLWKNLKSLLSRPFLLIGNTQPNTLTKAKLNCAYLQDEFQTGRFVRRALQAFPAFRLVLFVLLGDRRVDWGRHFRKH